MCQFDPNCPGNDEIATYPLPDHDDPHGWTVGFQIELGGGGGLYRTIGWVGTYDAAEKVCMIAAVMWSPVFSFGAVPAPRSDEPQGLLGITARPPLMPEDYPLDPHAANMVPTEYLAGAEALRLVDAMMPAPVLIAAKVCEALEARDIDIRAFFNEGRARGRDLDKLLGPEVIQQIRTEFPAGEITLGINPDDLPCICGNCNKPGRTERP